jgi:hypothetical protein
VLDEYPILKHLLYKFIVKSHKTYISDDKSDILSVFVQNMLMVKLGNFVLLFEFFFHFFYRYHLILFIIIFLSSSSITENPRNDRNFFD